MSAFAKIQYFPSMPLRFLTFLKSTRRQPHTLMLEVDKRMTKHEIKEYLTKVYDLPPPHKVNTAVFKGKWRRIAGKREVVTFRHNDWKKAFVMWKRFPGEGEGLASK
ncbi:hypothetical protein TrLO_g5615 [Triparma laevis f. longispina]|uniref:Large ribosomal subunit protein uL23m n=1 Tax=Triparma laevis f. longispina TaxID=1714387 RepID=A0A9W7F7X3_9STRA|nr:hypothetical protein TrLO_g5615 [Triparma laevis f. longispina]